MRRHSFATPSLPPTLSPLGTSRMGEYHRAKQNPAVLDQFYSSPSQTRLARNLYKTTPTPLSNSDRFGLPPGRQGSGLAPLRRAQTPVQGSLLKGRLQTYHSSPPGTSLVSLAVRGRLRQTESLPVSPVIVQLSNPTDAGNTSFSGRDSSAPAGAPSLDPCNKEVVISALKQKRKRWACTSEDGPTGIDSQPAAKRSR